MTKRTGIRKLTRWVTVETESSFDTRRKRRQRTRMYVYEDVFYCSLYDCTQRRAANISDDYGLCHDHILDTVTAAPQAIKPTYLIDRIRNVTDEAAARRDALIEDDRQRRLMNTPGWIYYIKVDDLIKIGYATVLFHRLKQYPPNITILAAHPGTRELETHLHRSFRLHLKRGREWYNNAQPIQDHIARVIAQYGTPDAQQPWIRLEAPWMLDDTSDPTQATHGPAA